MPSMAQVELQFGQQTAQISSSSEYLDHMMQTCSEQLPYFSHGYFCRRAKLKSRNAIREIITERKKLSLLTYQKIRQAIPLNQVFVNLFDLLVYRDYPEFDADQNRPITQQISSIQDEIQRYLEIQQGQGFQSEVLRLRNMLVFAALGDPETGSTQAEIQAKSGLREQAVEQVLKELESYRLLRRAGDRYYPQPAFFQTEAKDQAGVGHFRRIYSQIQHELDYHWDEVFSDKRNTIYQGVYSIDGDRLAEFRSELVDFMLNFVRRSHKTTGDKVARLSFSFFCR